MVTTKWKRPTWSALLLLTFLLAPRRADSMRLYMSRADALAMWGEKEGRIYLSTCQQSSNTGACEFAIDSSLSQEPSQCAVTKEQEKPYWLAVFEFPAYVTRVSLLNVDKSHKAYSSLDALTSFLIAVNDDVCFNYQSSEGFSQRVFPCDAVGDEIAIQIDRPEARILAICDVEIHGVSLKFPTLLGDDTRLKLRATKPCEMSSEEKETCSKAIDDVTSTDGASCVVSSKESKPWFEMYLANPAIVHQIWVYSTDLTKFKALVNKRNCAEHMGASTKQLWKATCSYFGDTVRIERDENAELTVCEVQAFGHSASIEPQKPYRYIGCFKEDLENRDLPKFASSTRMSSEKCYLICKRHGMKHFGMQRGMFCFCGDSYGKYGQADESTACDIKCQGESSEMCGGKLANSVFEINS